MKRLRQCALVGDHNFDVEHYLEAADALEAAETKLARARDALDYYQCAGLGQCTEVKLRDGSCVLNGVSQCGNIAHAALKEIDDAPITGEKE